MDCYHIIIRYNYMDCYPPSPHILHKSIGMLLYRHVFPTGNTLAGNTPVVTMQFLGRTIHDKL